MKFESHITFPISSAKTVEKIGIFSGWKYSQIEGDALLGAKPYCYLTAYEPTEEELYNRMMTVKAFAETSGIEVLRTKIERIIYDSKTGLNELEGVYE